jgi:hypothetical protein
MLLAIADFADDDGNAYPAVARLATKCRMKIRNANYILAALQGSGELQVRKNAGPKGTNRYRITVRGLQGSAEVQGNAGMQGSAAIPATDCPKPLQHVADKPSLNHQEPPTRRRRQPSCDEPPGFRKFWLTWPSHKRKANRAGSLKRWKTDGCESIAEEIVERVEWWKRSPDWTKDGAQYIPAPIVWLRDRRYEGQTPKTSTTSLPSWVGAGV